MATHSSILVWRIPWTEEPARLQSMGSSWTRLGAVFFYAALQGTKNCPNTSRIVYRRDRCIKTGEVKTTELRMLSNPFKWLIMKGPLYPLSLLHPTVSFCKGRYVKTGAL